MITNISLRHVCMVYRKVPHDVLFYINCYLQPMFRELTGDKLNISPSHRNGTEFPQGTFNILYTATNTDNSKTSLCKFTVTISGEC